MATLPKIGDRVVAGRNLRERRADGCLRAPYYSGEGKVVDVQKLRVKDSPSARTVIRTMVAVHLPTKGTIWFRPQDIKKARRR